MKNRLFTAKPFWMVSVMAIALLLLAACQPAADSPGAVETELPMATEVPMATEAPMPTEVPMATEEPMATEPAEVPATGGEMGDVMIDVATDPQYGEFLVDGEGMTLYMFTRDEPNVSNCAEQCLEAWPPLVAEGEVTVGEGLDESLLGTADLPDGRQIVTYNEMPLYYWVNDKAPGDTTGQGVNDVWYLVSPAGDVLDAPQASSMDEDAVVVNVAEDPTLGEILVDGDGMTLYMFTRDEPNVSNCADQCLEAWPPLLADGEVAAGEGVDETLFGTADLPDGRQIVTYNEMPLYYWVNDKEPGDMTGQGVNDVWYVVSPEGEPVGMDAGS
jgi:predicted lipoprotein with Yx(FWY)xxD motif